MGFVVSVVLWFLLLAIAWPLALLVLFLLPILWLLSIPFQILGVLLAAVFVFFKALLFLPARVLGGK
jgi:hypothetical protein